jgi:hypothetical protein
MEATQQFERLVDHFADREHVTLPSDAGGRAFGSEAIKVGGSIFAMLVGGRLVVKLPAERVQQLIDAADATAFEGSRGRPMREWAAITAADWTALAEEAYTFVAR